LKPAGRRASMRTIMIVVAMWESMKLRPKEDRE
jgi:hypothetical protein